MQNELFKGVPFLFGVIPVLLAIMVACCIQETEPIKLNVSRRRSDTPSLSTSTATTLPHRSHDNTPDTLYLAPDLLHRLPADNDTPIIVELAGPSSL